MPVLPLVLALATACAAVAASFNVKDYGAAGDGVHKDTAAIAKAIDACAKAGGGTVLLPPGRYLSGAISLHSNMTLEIGAGAVLVGSPDPRDYPLRDSVWGDGRKEISSLIWAADAENVTLRGHG